jgi:hypothetical protein
VAVDLAAIVAQSAVSVVISALKSRGQAPRSPDEVKELAPDDADVLTAVLPGGTVSDSATIGDDWRQLVRDSPGAPQAGLALSPDDVFRDARRRLELVFKVNLALSIAVGIILLGGVVAAIVLAIQGQAGIAAIFGGVALSDVIFAAVYQPLAQVNKSLISTQRLDMIHLSTRERLAAAQVIVDVNQRLAETKQIWDEIKRDLAALDGERA